MQRPVQQHLVRLFDHLQSPLNLNSSPAKPPPSASLDAGCAPRFEHSSDQYSVSLGATVPPPKVVAVAVLQFRSHSLLDSFSSFELLEVRSQQQGEIFGANLERVCSPAARTGGQGFRGEIGVVKALNLAKVHQAVMRTNEGVSMHMRRFGFVDRETHLRSFSTFT